MEVAMKVAALLANGHIITGYNHGDAFGKLTPSQKNGKITSGFIDPSTGEFILQEKEIILIRHAQAHQEQNDPEITDIGRSQASQTASYLLKELNLSEFCGFTSTARRCIQTAEIISAIIGVKFVSERSLCDRNEEKDHFLNRLNDVSQKLPGKSILISHSDFIITLIDVLAESKIPHIPNGSITFIVNGCIKWMAIDVQV